MTRKWGRVDTGQCSADVRVWEWAGGDPHGQQGRVLSIPSSALLSRTAPEEWRHHDVTVFGENSARIRRGFEPSPCLSVFLTVQSYYTAHLYNQTSKDAAFFLFLLSTLLRLHQLNIIISTQNTDNSQSNFILYLKCYYIFESISNVHYKAIY